MAENEMKLTYENVGKSTFLVYEVSEDDVVDQMSLKMITTNKIPGLVPTVFTQKDSEMYIKYNVTGKVTANRLLSKTMNKKRLLKLLFGIANAISSAEDYMIDPDCILMSLKHIYVSVSGFETDLVYLPVKRAARPVNLHAVVKRIMDIAQFDLSENCDYVDSIKRYLNQNEQLSSGDLKQLLNGVSTGMSLEPSENPHMPHDEDNGMGMMPQMEIPPVSQVPSMEQKQFVPEMEMPQSVSGPKEKKAKANSGKRKSKKESAAPVPSIDSGMGDIMPDLSASEEKGMSVFYLLQHYTKENKQLYKEQKARKKHQKAQGDALPKEEKKSKKKKKEKGLSEIDPLGFSMSGQEAGGFDMQGQMVQDFPMQGQMVQDFPMGGQMVQDFPMAGQMPQDFPAQGQGMQDFSLSGVGLSVPGQELSEPPKPKKGKSFLSKSAPAPKSEPAAPMGYAGAELDIPLEKSMDFGGTMYLPDDAYEATAYMDENEKEAEPVKHPIMIRKKDSERIEIDKPMFKMGRDRTVDDYVIPDNKYISRSHAMVLERDGRYFILDNKSKNHVSVNGERIEMDQEVELHDGDIFALGSEEFEFLLQ